MKVLRPNSVNQERFLASTADIVVFGGSAGGGKVAPTNSKVITPFGYKLMGDVKVGDNISNPDGSVQRVRAVYPHFDHQFYKLTFADGSSCEAGLEHLWVSWRARHQNKKAKRMSDEGIGCARDSMFPDNAKVVSTEEMLDWIKRGYHPLIPVTTPVRYNIAYKYKAEIDPYVLGLLLGDGCITKNVGFTRHIDDKELDQAFIDSGHDLAYSKDTKHVGFRKCEAKGKLLADLTRLRLLGTRSNTKFIPRQYLYSSIESRIAILQGMMDTDGYICPDGKLYYTSVSEEMSNNLKELVQSLGGLSTITSKIGSYKDKFDNKVMCQRAYTQYIRLPDNIVPFRIKRKLARLKPNGKRLYRTVVSIEPSRVCDGQCISVDNPNSLYMTDDFIVTHNTYSVLMDTLRYADDPNYRAVIFRRTSPQITSPGGLWDTASKIYTLNGIDGVARQKDLKYVFPSGAEVKFSHMEHESDRETWQGSQLSAVYFDEATHFSAAQITYMFSRLRSEADVSGYIRMTCNPDPDSPLRKWLDWWICPKTGLAIPERSGVLRYFVMLGDEWVWAGSKEVLLKDPDVVKMLADPKTGRVDRNEIMSFTFIPASLSDNVDMLKANPKYRAALMAMPRVDRERLLGGNWNTRASSGDYFNRKYCLEIDRNMIPHNLKRVRYWDRAGTKPNPVNENPDWTVGLLVGRCDQGYTYILDMVRFRDTPAAVRSTIASTADTDCILYPSTRVVVEQDPGAAGKSDVEMLMKALGRHDIRARPVTKAKLTRFLPFSAAAEGGMVRVVRGSWNDDFYNELEAFDGSGKGKDDIVDCASGGYLELEDKFNLPDFILPTMLGKSNNFSI